MKRCPKHYWFEYDETQGGCQLCEREGNAAVPPPVTAPPPPPAQEPPAYTLPAADWIEEGAGQPLPTPPQVWSPPIDMSKPEPPAWEPAPGWPERDIDRRDRRPDPEPEPEPIPVDPLTDEDSQILAQLEHLRANGVFTILLIGFFAGGKTWFLNRVKHQLGKEGYNVSPQPPRNRAHVTTTRNAEIHHARRLRDGKVESFAIVDIPGERLRDLVDKNFHAVRSVLAAMDMCGALIVALPADEVLLSEDVNAEAERTGGVHKVLLARTKDDPALHAIAQRADELVRKAGSVEAALGQEGPKRAEADRLREAGGDEDALAMLETDLEALKTLGRVERLAIADPDLAEFTHDLCFMTGLMSRLRNAGSLNDPRFDFRSIDPAAVNLHISSRDYQRFSRPTFVAMTKADLVSHPDPLLDALIRHSRDPEVRYTFSDDPLDTLAKMRPGLSAMFREWLSNVKFDFVTAFHEHDPTDTRIDYSAEHYGVGAVFDWISRARHWDARKASQRKAEARARRLRRLRDGKGSVDRDFGLMKGARR